MCGVRFITSVRDSVVCKMSAMLMEIFQKSRVSTSNKHSSLLQKPNSKNTRYYGWWLGMVQTKKKLAGKMELHERTWKSRMVGVVTATTIRGAGRSIIGGANIHIFVFCTINFFWNRNLDFKVNCFYSLWTRIYEYCPPPPPPIIDLPAPLTTITFVGYVRN